MKRVRRKEEHISLEFQIEHNQNFINALKKISQSLKKDRKIVEQKSVDINTPKTTDA